MNRASKSILAAMAAIPALAAICAAQDMAKAFGGKLLSYTDGVAVIRYDFEDPRELPDWDGIETGGDNPKAFITDGLLTINAEEKKFTRVMLDMPFTGDVTVEIRARVNPPRAREIIVYLYGPGAGYRTCAGYREKGDTFAYIIKSPGEILKKAKSSAVEPSQWYEMKVKAEGRNIGVFIDGRQQVSASDDDTRAGQVGIGTYWSSITVDWVKVQGKVDQSWLDARLAGSAAETTAAEMSFPGEDRMLGEMDEAARKSVESGKKWLAASKFVQAAAEFRKAAEGANRSPLGAYYLGRALIGAGDTAEAEKAFGRAIAGRDDFAHAYLWRANLRMIDAPAGDLVMALADLRSAIQYGEGQAGMFEALALLQMHRSDLESALAAAQKALRLRELSGEPAEALAAAAKLRDAYFWAARGVPAQKPLKVAAPFGEITGDSAQAAAEELMRWIGSVSSTLNLLTGDTPKNMKLVLLGDEKTRSKYVFPGAMTAHKSGAGYLNFALGEIVLYSSADSAAISRAGASLTARRMWRLKGSEPWVEEGFAAYFDVAPGAGGERPALGAPNPEAAAALKAALAQAGMPSAAALVRMKRPEFARDGSNLTALSYGLVHYMLHGPGGKRDFFRSYCRALTDGDTSPAMDEVDWNSIRPQWVEHMKRISE